MNTESISERITIHEDWKDGINAFRLSTREELAKVNEKLDYIMKVLDEHQEDYK